MRFTFTKYQLYLVLGLFIIVALLSFVGVYLYLNKDSGQDKKYSYILDNCEIDTSLTYYFDALQFKYDADPWYQREIQPVVKDYITEEGKNYLLGVVPDEDNDCTVLKILVSGDISTNIYLDDWAFDQINTFGDDQAFSFDELQVKAPINTQVRVTYLAAAPDIVNDKKCEYDSPFEPLYCTLQEVYEVELGIDNNAIEYLTPSNVYNGREFYASTVDNQIKSVTIGPFDGVQ